MNLDAVTDQIIYYLSRCGMLIGSYTKSHQDNTLYLHLDTKFGDIQSYTIYLQEGILAQLHYYTKPNNCAIYIFDNYKSLKESMTLMGYDCGKLLYSDILVVSLEAIVASNTMTLDSYFVVMGKTASYKAMRLEALSVIGQLSTKDKILKMCNYKSIDDIDLHQCEHLYYSRLGDVIDMFSADYIFYCYMPWKLSQIKHYLSYYIIRRRNIAIIVYSDFDNT